MKEVQSRTSRKKINVPKNDHFASDRTPLPAIAHSISETVATIQTLNEALPASVSESCENPYLYGFSLDTVAIPDEPIDFANDANRRQSIAIYRSFCLGLLSHSNRSLGFTRWNLGTVFNRLKPIRGGDKQIQRGEWHLLLRDLEISDDLSEEVRWVADIFSRDQALTTGWSKMRAEALSVRASLSSPKTVDESSDDPFAAVTPEQRAAASIDDRGWDEFTHDERCVVASALGAKIAKPKKMQSTESEPETQRESKMTPSTWREFLGKINKTLGEKVDAEWDWGSARVEETTRNIEEAINHVTAFVGKGNIIIEQLRVRLSEVGSRGAA